MARFCKTILLATDGAPDAELAARAAADLSSRAGAALHIVHAWSIYPTAIHPEPVVFPEGYPELFRDDAEAILNAAAEQIAGWGTTVAQTHLRLGRAAEEIVAVGREIGADLLVLGSRGHGRVARLVLGSVAEGVVHQAASPVLVVRGPMDAWPPTRVIVGDDGSEEAGKIGEFALHIADLVEASALLLRGIPPAPARAGVTEEHRQAPLTGVEAALVERAQQLAAVVGSRPQVLATIGDPTALLLDAADAGPGPALVAVGSRGLGRLGRLRLGSVSTKVLHAGRWPVLIGPPAPS